MYACVSACCVKPGLCHPEPSILDPVVDSDDSEVENSKAVRSLDHRESHTAMTGAVSGGVDADAGDSKITAEWVPKETPLRTGRRLAVASATVDVEELVRRLSTLI